MFTHVLGKCGSRMVKIWEFGPRALRCGGRTDTRHVLCCHVEKELRRRVGNKVSGETNDMTTNNRQNQKFVTSLEKSLKQKERQ